MSLFSVMYLNDKLVAAMFLWQGATIADCQQVNANYIKTLPSSPLIKSGKVKLSDIKMTCEYHKKNPVKNPVKNPERR